MRTGWCRDPKDALTSGSPIRTTLVLSVLLTSLVLSGITHLATASAAPSRAPLADSAREVATSVKGFRSSMRRELDDYVERYGSRLSDSETERLSALITRSDSDLRRLVYRVEKVARWEKRGNARRTRQAASQAIAAYEFALQRANSAISEMQPILRPKLNVFEALEANSTLNARMTAYENLESQIRSLT